MALAARTLQRVRFSKCVFLSDAGLCAMAEFLWLEQLDVSGCHRITDDGLEVLAEVSSFVPSFLPSFLPSFVRWSV